MYKLSLTNQISNQYHEMILNVIAKCTEAVNCDYEIPGTEKERGEGGDLVAIVEYIYCNIFHSLCDYQLSNIRPVQQKKANAAYQRLSSMFIGKF